MIVMLVFVGFIVVTETAAVAISAIVEHFSKSASLMVFFVLFAGAFWVSWVGAVWVTERFFIRQAKPQAPVR